MSERYAVVGLAQPRSGWFREVARWSSTAALPIDVAIGVSGAEVIARLEGGRSFSALLADATHPDLDGDLIALAAARGCITAVVDDGSARRDWTAVGAVATLPALFDRASLAAVLGEHATPVADLGAGTHLVEAPVGVAHASVLAAVGPGGSGTSTVARAVAQALGGAGRDVVLADLALHADQAALHDVGDVIPGLQELVDASRRGPLDPGSVAELTWTATHVPYRLLLGLRRHRDWAALRERATTSALAALRRATDLVVADVDDDLDGEPETGSADVEDRNRLARVAVGAAHLVLITTPPDVRGLRRLATLAGAVRSLGVEDERLVPVVVGAPRRPHRRAALVAAVDEVLADGGPSGAQPPLFVPWRADVARSVLDGRPLPAPVVEPLDRPVRLLLERVAAPGRTASEPVAVEPGALGHWWPADEVGA